MLPRLHDTIVAIATAPGRGAIGIVRVSGARLDPLIKAICGAALEARRAHYLPLLGADGAPIDKGLAIYFAAPNSYTGEDVLELQAHGGPVVLQLLLARCLEAGAEIGARIAAPGEFTQRAYLNGKLDLAQAEAVGDLIDASTEAAARSAAQSLSGSFSSEIKVLAGQIVELRALVEATLDFPEEEIDFLDRAGAHARLERITAALEGILLRAQQGVLLRDGIKVVLAGQPNVGKSSLLNALAGAELAIVTPLPGTTRDKVSGTIQIEGVPIHVVDTAGLRDSIDPIERIGVQRAWAEVGSADLVLFVHDLTRATQPDYVAAEARLASQISGALGRGTRLLQVHNKADAAPMAKTSEGVSISAVSGAGLTALRQTMLDSVGWQRPAEGAFLARARHVHALQLAQRHVAQATLHALQANAALELFAEELRLAHRELEQITGRFTSEDLLGEIFGRFCIGK